MSFLYLKERKIETESRNDILKKNYKKPGDVTHGETTKKKNEAKEGNKKGRKMKEKRYKAQL